MGDLGEQGVAEVDVAAAGVDGALFDGERKQLLFQHAQQLQDAAAEVGVGVIDREEVLVDLEHRAGGAVLTGLTGWQD